MSSEASAGGLVRVVSGYHLYYRSRRQIMPAFFALLVEALRYRRS
jgi:hypothetical protein